LNTTLTTKKAVGYLRVSTPGQAGSEHNSLEAQEGRYKEYCQRNNLLPVCHFVDVVSGRRDDRKEYRRMVDYAIEGNADVIVVQFLDRFDRNPREILQRYWELQDVGASVVATDEDIKEELLLLIKAGIAGAESRRTSKGTCEHG
jgi:DNA invertase Pin-like site-specific DNA recombinase